MPKLQFRVLYRQFLFRIVDLELLSVHAEGDSRKLLGQFASLLIYCSIILTFWALIWASGAGDTRLPPLMRIMGAWTVEHFLIATTMLVVGLFAVLSWESTFPDRRDVLVLGPLPVATRTLFFAKVAGVGTALGLTLLCLHCPAGLAWPFALASYDSAPAPALVFDSQLPPLTAASMPSVMDRDIAPILRRLDLAAADHAGGIVVGVSTHGARSVRAYGSARPDSLFEIGSVTKTFTGLLLAQMARRGELDLNDPVREFLPADARPSMASREVTLADLATHRSGLPRMPDNTGPGNVSEAYTNYHVPQLYEFVKTHGLSKEAHPQYLYSNLGFSLLGAALSNRAHTEYSQLLQRDITGPLHLSDTVITLTPDQQRRMLTGHDGHAQPTPAWDLDVFDAAGGIRSTAGDLLTYLEAQLHPETTPFADALNTSHLLRAIVAGHVRIALAWHYDGETRTYFHNGATGGFTAVTFFNPSRDYAGVVLVNSASFAYPFNDMIGLHLMQRLSGEPAISLSPVTVPAPGPVRSFFGYWITMLAAGVFTYCCVLTLQGFAAQLLPRRWFLRTSALLQIGVFAAFVCGYFLQRSPTLVLVDRTNQSWFAWIPSYWFVGMYQQIAGSLHPALAPFAQRAWIGLTVALVTTAVAYAAAYLRTLRRIVEEPDIAPDFRSSWLPRFGPSLESAIVQFSIRSLLRSRQHRMIFSFYLGTAIALTLLLLNAPASLTGPPQGDPAQFAQIPLLAATLLIMCLWIVGARIVFSLPLDLKANWLFRAAPFNPGRACLNARRKALVVLAVAPAWILCAVMLALSDWPRALVATHVVVLALLGIVIAEFSVEGVLKIPFTCSYLPGRANLQVTFPLVFYMLLGGLAGAAISERKLLNETRSTVILLACLAVAALIAILRNNGRADPGQAELRYEEQYPDQLVSMDLS